MARVARAACSSAAAKRGARARPPRRRQRLQRSYGVRWACYGTSVCELHRIATRSTKRQFYVRGCKRRTCASQRRSDPERRQTQLARLRRQLRQGREAEARLGNRRTDNFDAAEVARAYPRCSARRSVLSHFSKGGVPRSAIGSKPITAVATASVETQFMPAISSPG